MDDADDHGVETLDTIEQKIIADDERPGVWRDLGTRRSKLRITSQTLASGDDPVDEAVRSGRVVQSDVEPDVIKVGLGARRIDDASHVSGTCGFLRRQTLTSAAFDVFGV